MSHYHTHAENHLIAQLRAENEALRKDAERYRYLCKEVDDRDGWLAVSNWDTVQWDTFRTGVDLDAALGAAIAKVKEQK